MWEGRKVPPATVLSMKDPGTAHFLGSAQTEGRVSLYLSQPHSKRSRVLSFGKRPDSSGQGGFETSFPSSHDLRLGYAPVCPWCLGLAPEICVAVIPVSHTEALGIRSSGLVPHQHLFIQPTFHFTRDDWFSLPSWLSLSACRVSACVCVCVVYT